MKIYRLGSCRVFYIPNTFQADHSFINEAIGYSHTLKEHVQLIKFLKEEITIPEELLKYIFTFYGGDQRREDINQVYASNRKALREAEVFVAEVSSLKILQYQNLYFQISRFDSHHLWNIPKPSDELLDNTRHYKQDEAEFYHDFKEFLDLVDNRPVIFTGHINIKTKEGTYIESRRILNGLLQRYSNRHGMHYYDLSDEIESNLDKYIDDDLTHLRGPAWELAGTYIEDIIENQLTGSVR
ncbi:MAG: hypothetical protein GF398_15205 [Chitinivibrionales bacterium]|nr:hypothetical protein [Chitinivibrionales bacterium]